MAAARRRTTRRIPSQVLALAGGPYSGKCVRLSGDAIQCTAEFTASGMTGHYEKGVWKEKAQVVA